MGWLKDSAREASSILGVPWRVGDSGLLKDAALCRHVTVDQITSFVRKPVEFFVNPYILCLVIVDADGKRYAVQSTALSYYWPAFIKAMESYVRVADHASG
jgi:hypothetical protein